MAVQLSKVRRKTRHWVSVALLRLVLGIVRLLPFRIRIRLGTRLLGALAAIPKHAREPIEMHTKMIFPDWSDEIRSTFTKLNIKHFSQNLMELYNIEDFSKHQEYFHVSGEGLKTLEMQKKNGRGAIIVSGHFGHWEAIRAYWNARGMPLGAVYKEAHNPYYESMFAHALQHNGPAVHTGVRGMSKLVRIVKSGGFISLLHDQKLEGAPLLPFMGKDVHTSTAAAEMAIKYDVPLVPAYAIRRENGYEYDIIFEAPIPKNDAIEMTRAMNASLEARILEKTDQWLWLYDRWTIFEK